MKIRYTTPFTMIENKIIRSKELTVYQKMTFITLCSYANDNNICFPSYETIAGVVGCSRRKVIDIIKELVDLKLIIKHKCVTSRGDAAANEYEIVVSSEYRSPPDEHDALPGNAQRSLPGEYPAPKQYTNNNINESVNHNHPSISKYDVDKMEKTVKAAIEYDILAEQVQNRNQLDEIVALIVDTVSGTTDTIRIGGNDYPHETVKERLLSLAPEHIQYVINMMKNNTTKVRNIRSYMLTSLYNAPVTMESYYQTRVNNDLYGDGGG